MTDALVRKYLATMQLSVYESEASPSTKLEAYIMDFAYTEVGAEMTFQISGRDGQRVSARAGVSNTKEELRHLLHHLTKHIKDFPRVSCEHFLFTIFKSMV
jgi:hypothetical protein